MLLNPWSINVHWLWVHYRSNIDPIWMQYAPLFMTPCMTDRMVTAATNGRCDGFTAPRGPQGSSGCNPWAMVGCCALQPWLCAPASVVRTCTAMAQWLAVTLCSNMACWNISHLLRWFSPVARQTRKGIRSIPKKSTKDLGTAFGFLYQILTVTFMLFNWACVPSSNCEGAECFKDRDREWPVVVRGNEW